MLNLSRFTRFFGGVKFGLEDLLRVKDLTFGNSARYIGNIPTKIMHTIVNCECILGNIFQSELTINILDVIEYIFIICKKQFRIFSQKYSLTVLMTLPWC